MKNQYGHSGASFSCFLMGHFRNMMNFFNDFFFLNGKQTLCIYTLGCFQLNDKACSLRRYIFFIEYKFVATNIVCYEFRNIHIVHILKDQ